MKGTRATAAGPGAAAAHGHAGETSRHAPSTRPPYVGSGQDRGASLAAPADRTGAPARAGASAGGCGGAGGNRPSSQPPSTSFQPDLGRGAAGFAWGMGTSFVSGISGRSTITPGRQFPLRPCRPGGFFAEPRHVGQSGKRRAAAPKRDRPWGGTGTSFSKGASLKRRCAGLVPCRQRFGRNVALCAPFGIQATGASVLCNLSRLGGTPNCAR